MISVNLCVYPDRRFGVPGPSTLNYLSRYAQARGLRPAWRLAFKVARRPVRFADWLIELENYRTRLALSDAGLHSYAIAPSSRRRAIAGTEAQSRRHPCCAQSFAVNAGCSDVLAVSDESHIINLQTKGSLRRKAAKYDTFWLERGGSPGGSRFRLAGSRRGRQTGAKGCFRFRSIGLFGQTGAVALFSNS